jgi:hypothetical protein
MDRKLVITTMFLVVALTALTAGGLFDAAGGPAPVEAGMLPQPASRSVAEAQAPSASGHEPMAAHALAPAGMSGDFAKRSLADAGSVRAPSICVPANRWS